MLWSGSSPLTVVRDGMWGFLLFAGVAWLAIAWSVLRLEPADLATVAGPVILFGAVTEAVRALAGTRTWWLNAGLAVLFAATGVIMLRDTGSSWTTPAALIGWYLLVRGAADIAISMLTRESDRIWGLLMVVGVVETALGFFSASSFVRTPELVVVVLGGAALTRGVADLVASLRLREASAAARAGRLLELTPERAVGVAGYTAGMTDFEAGSQTRAASPRHRALPKTNSPVRMQTHQPHDLGPTGTQAAMPALGPAAAATAAGAGSAADATGAASAADPHFGAGAAGAAGTAGYASAAGYTNAGEAGTDGGSFHDEVLRTTADLDAMLALAGVTGAAVPGAAARAAADEYVDVPDTAEGAELPVPEEVAAAGAVARRQSAQGADDATLPLLDPAARAAESATTGMDDTSIITRSRRLD
jgi:uncharacterized membrane protein HdeD (DUF308 family)